jgi:hypothetical protein
MLQAPLQACCLVVIDLPTANHIAELLKARPVRAATAGQHQGGSGREKLETRKPGPVRVPSNEKTTPNEKTGRDADPRLLRHPDAGQVALHQVLSSEWWDWSSGSSLLFWRWWDTNTQLRGEN